jgi:2,4-dienoyl-CoA reductase-like NADH-dependent reductase (Old Yellow Enzyme family)
MTEAKSELNQPLPLSNGAPIPNRIAKAAMSERLADPEGAPSEALVRLYQRWADGGAGLLITGNVMVDRRALGETGNVIVEDERHIDALRAWAQAAKSRGARLWMQINHPGRQSPRFLSKKPVAPSAVPMGGPGSLSFSPPRALSDDEVHDIVARFGKTAAVAEAAGFDGVQIHAAHGYLISQFLSPSTNLREDRWGGSREKRRRFLIEVVRAVRAATGPNFTVAVKLNSADFQKGGFSEAESMSVVRALAEEGIDLLEISGGTYESAAMFAEAKPQRTSTKRREAFFIDYAEKVRSESADLPLMVTGGFRTRTGMMDALASGAVDVVGMARPLCVETDLPRRLLSGEAEAARSASLAAGIKNLDSLIQASWYQSQLTRMGRGLAPDAQMSRVAAIVRYLLPRRRVERAS